MRIIVQLDSDGELDYPCMSYRTPEEAKEAIDELAKEFFNETITNNA